MRVRGLGVAVDAREHGEEGGERERVGYQAEGGLLALLGDAVGDESEGGGFVGAGGEDLEGERGEGVGGGWGCWRGRHFWRAWFVEGL